MTALLARVAALATAAAMVLSMSGCVSDRDFSAISSQAPVSAVLLSGRHSTVQLFDSRSGARVGHLRLRSAAFDLAADAQTRTFLTAQAGGVGPESDDRLGVIDCGKGRVEYVRLPWPNPVQVAAARGRAYVLHGVEGPQGLRLSVVDIARRSVCATGVVSPRANDLFAAGDRVYLTIASADDADDAGDLYRLDPDRLDTEHLAHVDAHGGGFGVSGGPDAVLLVGRAVPAASGAPRARIQILGRGSESTVTAVRVTAGVEQAAATGDAVALLDADSGADPRGRGAVVLADRSGAVAARLPVRLPAAVSAAGELFAVADGGRGRIAWVDASGAVRRESPLPLDAVGVSVAALP